MSWASDARERRTQTPEPLRSWGPRLRLRTAHAGLWGRRAGRSASERPAHSGPSLGSPVPQAPAEVPLLLAPARPPGLPRTTGRARFGSARLGARAHVLRRGVARPPCVRAAGGGARGRSWRRGRRRRLKRRPRRLPGRAARGGALGSALGAAPGHGPRAAAPGCRAVGAPARSAERGTRRAERPAAEVRRAGARTPRADTRRRGRVYVSAAGQVGRPGGACGSSGTRRCPQGVRRGCGPGRPGSEAAPGTAPRVLPGTPRLRRMLCAAGEEAAPGMEGGLRPGNGRLRPRNEGEPEPWDKAAPQDEAAPPWRGDCAGDSPVPTPGVPRALLILSAPGRESCSLR